MYKKQVAMLTVVSVKGSRTLTVVAEVRTDKNLRTGVYFALWVLVMASIMGPYFHILSHKNERCV